MADEDTVERAKAAWVRIESLGGHGVWESDLVVVSLKSTGISDDDPSLFSEFPYVQILDISGNSLTDGALKHLEGISSLESLNVSDTQISEDAIVAFRSAHPTIEVRTQPLPPSTINPFTGKPIGE